MSWSYSGDPAASSLCLVRFLAGDTEQNPQSVSDEEIEYLLETTTPRLAAAQVAEAISRKYALKPDRTVGSLTITYKAQADAFARIAHDLRTNAGRDGGNRGPVWGGGGPTYLGPSDAGMAPYNPPATDCRWP